MTNMDAYLDAERERIAIRLREAGYRVDVRVASLYVEDEDGEYAFLDDDLHSDDGCEHCEAFGAQAREAIGLDA